MRRSPAVFIALLAATAVAAVPALAATPKNGKFAGKSSKKRPVEIDVKGGKLTRVLVEFTCKGDPSKSKVRHQFGMLDGTVTGGKFSEEEKSESGYVLTFSGRFTKP